MRLHRFIRTIAPIAVMALATGLNGCSGNAQYNSGGDVKGVPLAELDMSGPAPSEVTLAGPDSIIITDGDTLTIKAEGDQAAIDALRFELSGDTLTVARDNEVYGSDDIGTATVRITMPSPERLAMAGSGGLAAQSMAANAEVEIAGSGRIDVASMNSDNLEVAIAGSGSFGTAGTSKNLDLGVAGSGALDAIGLSVERAEISIAGSGNAKFSSDGTVKADIAGSGNVDVTGSATCTVNSMGNGTVTCRAAHAE